MLYVVRHAEAGSRSRWDGPDWLRPLNKTGRAQARALIGQLHEARFTRIVTSPYVRCMETVVPVAGHHMLAVEPHDALAEGATLDATLVLLKELSATGAVVCSHGDVIPMVLDYLRSVGVAVAHDAPCEKGSTWELECVDGTFTAVRHIPPPAV